MTTAAYLEANAIQYLVVHCADTPDEDQLPALDIHKMHLGFGWDGVGYHRVIRRDGTIEQGRPDFWIGAHVYGHNHESLGVCLIGRSQFTDAQMQALEDLMRDWKAQHPKAEIRGHCDFENTEKTCPNFDAGAWARDRGLQ